MNMFKGVWVALVTPFSNGRVDTDAMRRLVTDLAASGVSGFVPLGTTGEASTLSLDERKTIIKLCLEAAGDVPVVPGCGTNNTAQSIELVKLTADLGAQGAMVITPYYNKPTQQGLIAHFTAIADSTTLPLMLYNVPGRTSVNMLPDTVDTLADHKNIAALKEASGNLEQISDICDRVRGRMHVLSGDDALTFPIMSVGGTGVVSVVAHVIPEAVVKMVDLFLDNEWKRALPWHRVAYPVTKAMFAETSPAPVKYALELQGKIKNELRLPMVPASEKAREIIQQALKEYELFTAV
ncbi:4-hydroxy-tetrahydrodipicolinate synthase, partial [bacterium]|nr:4-hydroxy-tetrahydrodipicolinate synthase [bacterium]